MVPTIPGFLRLPLEIRQLIYHYLLAQNFQSRSVDMTVRQRHGGYKLQGLESIQGLVFVSRTFLDEILSYCFSRFNFFLHNGSESIRFVVREFYRQIGAENRKLVKYITIPKFSIDRVIMHPSNMVALFASYQARSMQLLDEMQGAFALLERFPALEELDLGLDTYEATRLSDFRYHDRNVQAHPMTRNKRIIQGHGRAYDFYIRDALQEARGLSARVTIGIWWTSYLEVSLDTDKKEAREEFLHRIREDIAPVRVVCKGIM
ncbi:hypothetical protein BKA58DRAFT_378718 [Alternaria rosae]|uniref:uncharacterized protein n=1 Tax=Alternaria rosae TaxID=1187941 RepID=UPI001E8ECB38|nr:uncharacterized protein BKA58DRAFT_378718 [Alternaria rosae]KAH6879131.1 hypothetical protein BKA58DRAFT_378718 [Alternaria rosae]